MEPTDSKGNLAKQIRKKRGKIKLKVFATLVNVHKDQLSRYEKGKSIPRTDIYKRIMEYEPSPLLGAEKTFDPKIAYEVSTTEENKFLEMVKKILNSENPKAVEALKANIEAFYEMAVTSKNNDENKGGD